MLKLQAMWPSKVMLKSLKVIDNGAIRQATYDFLSVVYCNYLSTLHHKSDGHTDGQKYNVQYVQCFTIGKNAIINASVQVV